METGHSNFENLGYSTVTSFRFCNTLGFACLLSLLYSTFTWLRNQVDMDLTPGLIITYKIPLRYFKVAPSSFIFLSIVKGHFINYHPD